MSDLFNLDLDVKFGIKHPGGAYGPIAGSVRHEWSLFEGFEQETTYTVSNGVFEVVGLANNPNYSTGDLFEPGFDKIGGIKKDFQGAAGPVPVVAGLSFDPFTAKTGLRGGVGTNEINAYVEVEIDVDIHVSSFLDDPNFDWWLALNAEGPIAQDPRQEHDPYNRQAPDRGESRSDDPRRESDPYTNYTPSPDWTNPAADPLDLGLTPVPGQDTYQGYNLYYGYDPRNPQPVPDPAPVTGPVGGPPPGTGGTSSGGGRPGGQIMNRRRITKPPIIIPVAAVAAARMAVV